jgi:hypothetical protein
MHQIQQAIVMMAAELDALADFGWHVPAIRGYVTSCLNAVRARWRRGVSHRLAPTPLPVAEASSPV